MSLNVEVNNIDKCSKNCSYVAFKFYMVIKMIFTWNYSNCYTDIMYYGKIMLSFIYK